MRLGTRKILGVSMLGLLSGMALAGSAQAQWRDETMARTTVLRRLGATFLLTCVVGISTAGCLLVPVPVGPGRGYHHHGRW